MTLKLAHFCDDPKKISTKSSYPQKILFFLKTPKNIEVQNFETKKNGPSLCMCENIRVPPWASVTYSSPWQLFQIKANSGDGDKITHIESSDMGLHYLPMSYMQDTQPPGPSMQWRIQREFRGFA